MIDPQRAAVRPRVFANGRNDALPLEDEIHRFLETGQRGAVAIFGPAGSGKTAALRHLAAVLPASAPVTLLDEPMPHELSDAPPERLTVFAAAAERKGDFLGVYRLAPWTRDDAIEYLLAKHPRRCASVMARIRPRDVGRFRGLADLWEIVLERLADDESLPDARAALHAYLREHLADVDLLERARSVCLNAAVRQKEPALEKLAKPGFGPELMRALRHEALRELLAAERIAADLRGAADCDFLARYLPRGLVEAAAGEIAEDAAALEHLRRLVEGPSWAQAMSASLLHAAGTGWIPTPGAVPVLEGAYLNGVLWLGVQLPNVNLSRADLADADLRGANLSFAQARKACLRNAQLHGANLETINAWEADLAGADLSAVQAPMARLVDADLSGANLDDAMLERASFGSAKLTGATLRGADLRQASFSLTATVLGADFSGANLRGAVLMGLKLRETRLDGACLTKARLNHCDLEGMTLYGADFEGAVMRSTLLTGSTMPGANFNNACLRGAGLAEVEWEGASLRSADLTAASFHLGTTRSGLVGSSIPCEGSRTGFYTDDYEEQTYKAPEEIRKANLCGADLRGAKVDKTDFYLVDLRGALFDEEQGRHFRRCGAILERGERGA